MAHKKIDEVRNEDGSRKVVTHWNTEWQEYQVCLFIDGEWDENSTYYTTDKQDALGTMRAMFNHE